MKKLNVTFAFLLASVLFLPGCTEGTTEKQYIKLSDVTCTLLQDGSKSKTVTVKSSPVWTAESGEDWLRITDQTPDSFTFSADANTGAERSGVITVSAGEAKRKITVLQLGSLPMNARYRLLREWEDAAISPSGRYVGGFYNDPMEDNTYQFTPVIIDLQTDQWYELGPYPQDLFDLFETEAVTDQGLLYITDSAYGGVVEFSLDGSHRRPASAPGCGPTVVQSSSADGSVLVGYAEGSASDYLFAPLKIVDGVIKLLPMPEKNFRGEDFWAGILARGCSADGSIIYGTTWENQDYGMVYWDKNGDVHYVGEDVHKLVETITIDDGHGEPYQHSLYNGMTCESVQMLVSPSGEWIAGTYRTETLGGKDGKETINAYYPAFYNTVTGKTTIMDEYAGCSVNAVTDDGIGFINDGRMMITSGRVVDIKTGTELGTTKSWIEDQYGINVPNAMIYYSTPDQKFLFGMKAEATAAGPSWVYWYVGPAL